MTAFTITLDEVAWNGVSARVTKVGEVDGRRAFRMFTRKVVVSAGAKGATSIDVPSGEYVVEAVLPTGDVVSGACTVDGRGPVSIDIGGMHSSNGSITADLMPAQGLRDYEFPSAAGMLSMAIPEMGGGRADMEPSIFAMRASSRSTWPHTAHIDLSVPRAHDHNRGEHDGRLRFPLASHVVSDADGTVGYEIDGSGASEAPGPLWMEFVSGTCVETAMLPVPWLPEADEASGHIGRTKVRVDVPANGPPRVSVGDPRFGAMLGYLANRRVSEARAALEAVTADAMPGSEKDEGGASSSTAPFAYLAACYVGILQQDASTERWGRLAQRLQRACPASVDAMVATARYLLVTARDTADLDRARSLFLQASEGPPPTLTIGVQMLLDGLSAFADEDDAVARRRKDFMRVARSVDIEQPFTVLTCMQEAV